MKEALARFRPNAATSGKQKPLLARIPLIGRLVHEESANIPGLESLVLMKVYTAMQEHGFTIHTKRSSTKPGIPHDIKSMPLVLSGKNGKSIDASLHAVAGDRDSDSNTLSLLISEDWPFGKNMRRVEYIVSKKPDGSPGFWGTSTRYIFEGKITIADMNKRQIQAYLKAILGARVNHDAMQKAFDDATQQKPHENETREVFWNKGKNLAIDTFFLQTSPQQSS